MGYKLYRYSLIASCICFGKSYVFGLMGIDSLELTGRLCLLSGRLFSSQSSHCIDINNLMNKCIF